MKPDWCYCPHCGTKERPENNTQQPARSSLPANSHAPFGSSVRAQVFEVVVRQAVAGAPWRLICAGPMKVNNITEDMVEEELKRRKNGGATPSLDSPPEPPLPPGDTGTNTEGTLPSRVIDNVAFLLEGLVKDPPSIFAQKQESMKNLANTLRLVVIPIKEMEKKMDENT
jgi:hypothetical protein